VGTCRGRRLPVQTGGEQNLLERLDFHAKIIVEGVMPNQTMRLVFPPRLQDEPIITQMLRQYSFTVNILRANVSEDQGWMDIQISGKPSEIESAASWLRQKGVEVVILTN
jgi:ABC-type methionine transport system ATPase subunit